ncbi:hypothetical protein GLOIN_2v1614119 [Rhizophagus irregularis DAOM 181602=DAOM 197198]|nr:hypothetical protein GLOIN_2v1614119 [Rhizophagus irregularis DAOM 181602=DAOM 197198]
MLIDDVPYNIVDTPGILDPNRVGRFTDEQKDALNRIRNFLGKNATNNIISVLSRADKDQTEDRSIMQSDWNQSFRSFIQGIGNRWGISPNPEIFPAGERLINNMRSANENKRKRGDEKEEDEKRAKREHDEKLKEDARREAERAHQREFNQMRQEYEKQHRQILEKMIESLRREKENERQEKKKSGKKQENIKKETSRRKRTSRKGTSRKEDNKNLKT